MCFSTPMAPLTEMRTEFVSCPFCEIEEKRILLQTENFIVIRDQFPVTLGHTLLIPRRHIPTFFELSLGEKHELIEMVEHVMKMLKSEFSPAGFNIGINDGTAAGQTVKHLHVHLIPRYAGDTKDPRVGIRWVIPGKADYWS